MCIALCLLLTTRVTLDPKSPAIRILHTLLFAAIEERPELQGWALKAPRGRGARQLMVNNLYFYLQTSGATPRQETYLESPHLYTTEKPGPQDQRTILDHRQTLPTIAEQQTTNLQGNIETGMDLWNTAMGMRFTIKYRVFHDFRA